VSNGLDQRKWKFCGEESLIQNKGNGGAKTMIVLERGPMLLGRGDQIRALRELGPDARVTEAMSSMVSTVTASCAAPILSICRYRCRDMWPIAAVRLAQQLLIDASGPGANAAWLMQHTLAHH
jgi:hypothetical protein